MHYKLLYDGYFWKLQNHRRLQVTQYGSEYVAHKTVFFSSSHNGISVWSWHQNKTVIQHICIHRRCQVSKKREVEQKNKKAPFSVPGTGYHMTKYINICMNYHLTSFSMSLIIVLSRLMSSILQDGKNLGYDRSVSNSLVWLMAPAVLATYDVICC